MGVQNGTITTLGKVGNIQGNKRTGTKKFKDFIQARKPSNKAHFNTAASMQNVRNNAAEFGGAGLQSKALNAATAKTFLSVAGKNFHRIQKVFVSIIKLGIGIAGERPFSLSLWKSMLLGLTMGRNAFKSICIAGYNAVLNVGRNQMTVTFPTIPANQIFAPKGATHFRIKLGFYVQSDAAYDPDSKKYVADDPNGNIPVNELVFSPWLPVGVDVPLPTIVDSGVSTYVVPATDTAISILGIDFAILVGTEYNLMIGNSAGTIINVG